VLPGDEVTLIAHRGDAARHPENTLEAFAAAARLGVRHVELDVQLTADHVPVVLHDETLRRTHGLRQRVTAHTLAELARLGVLTGGTRPPAVPRLAEFASWLEGEPGLHAFVEIKKESLRAHGRHAMLAAIEPVLRPVSGRVTVISYDAPVLGMAQRAGFETGYVLPGMSRRARGVAQRLSPRYLFVDRHHLVRAGACWPGPWTWAVFEVDTPVIAGRLLGMGVKWLESMNPARLLAAGMGPAARAR